jgi:TatD DNase family protein
MKLIDTHAHLYDPALLDQLPDVLQRAQEAGVAATLVIGTEPANSRSAVEIAQRHASVWAVVGFQPNHCRDLTAQDWEDLLSLARDSRVVGLGETGLDRYWDDCPFEIQQQWFARHWEAAGDLSLPIVIHMRDCEADIVSFLQERKSDWPLAGVMHSFTGSWETAQVCLEAGLHLSFAGMLTYKSSGALREVARQVPGDRLLVETDSPYLSPEPHRGKRPNEPARVRHTAECLAAVRGVSLADISHLTTHNACQLFRLPLGGGDTSVEGGS